MPAMSLRCTRLSRKHCNNERKRTLVPIFVLECFSKKSNSTQRAGAKFMPCPDPLFLGLDFLAVAIESFSCGCGCFYPRSWIDAFQGQEEARKSVECLN